MALEAIGHYALRERLGEGGMGEVFRARDTRLDRSVAIKRLHSAMAADPQQLERFRREARAVARLSHPAIVQVYDILSEGDSDWIVMEYVEGRTLRSWLTGGPLAPHRAIPLTREIAEGLAEAHGKGVVHRDLKTENVIVTPEGHAKIVDFGIAKRFARSDAEDSLTGGGMILGTVRAMSPEQARGEDVSPRSDLFSLGILLYETLAGRTPFADVNPLRTVHRICNEPHLSLEMLEAEVPEPLSRLVDHLLQKDPSLRPRSAREVVQALEEIGRRADGEATDVQRTLMVRHPPATGTVVKTLMLAGLADGAGPAAAGSAAARHERVARDLFADFGGREIDRGDAFLLLFDRPIDALRCGLAYHQSLRRLSAKLDVDRRAPAAIHLGEVTLRRGPEGTGTSDPVRVEIDGGARPVTERLLALALGGQTLLTRGAFDLARQAAANESTAGRELRWLAHGPYLFDGAEEPVEVFEVGEPELAPLRVPADSETAHRVVATGEEAVLGWRPAPGQPIPGRSGWTLERKLGEGGFGEVWLAAHGKMGEERVFKFCFAADRLRALRREVVLFRVLKESLGHRDDIARILNWSFETPPFSIESEYTQGGNLVDWAAEQGGIGEVPLATRLELVAQVADALAAAHSVGVLHKDVKPANVLVAADGRGRPRAVLTDFGIGLLTDRTLLESSGITDLKGVTEIMASAADAGTGGTQIYTAPELIEGRPPTIQADIYALGVMLYQMAAGNLSHALAPGWERDVDDGLLRDDIAGLVDGTPGRRPGSASEVAVGLRALEERRERRRAEQRSRERERKAHRRRRLLATVAAVATVFLVVVSILAVQALDARREADRRRQQAESLIGFMLGDLRQKLDPIGRLDILDEVGDQALAYFDALPTEELTDEELFRLSQALYQIGEVRMDQGDYEAAAEVLQESLALAQEAVRRDPDNTERLASLGESHFWTGALFWKHREMNDALEQFEAYRTIAEDLFTRNPENAEWRRELGFAHNNIGLVLKEKGQPDAALEPLRFALQIKEELLGRDPDDLERQQAVATGYNSLASAIEATGDLRAALERYQTELAIWVNLVTSEPNNSGWRHKLAVSHQYVAQLSDETGESEAAKDHHRAAVSLATELTHLDPANRTWLLLLAVGHLGLGRSLLDSGDPQAAFSELQVAREILEGSRSPDSEFSSWQLRLAACYNAIAEALAARGDPGSALIAVRSALAILEPAAERRAKDEWLHRQLSDGLIILGNLWLDLEQPEKANAAWERARDVIEPFSHRSEDRRILALYARSLLHLDRVEEARAAVEELRLQGYRQARYLTLVKGKGLASNFSSTGTAASADDHLQRG